jgi:hypothetical protein
MINLFEKNAKDPIVQALIVLSLTLIVMICSFILQKIDPSFVSLKFYWLTTTAFMLFYAVFNSISSIASNDGLAFWGRSMYSYMGLAVSSGLLAWGFSGVSIFDAGSYSWLFKVVTVVYIVFMTVVRSMKTIVEFAQKEEWNSPNLRKRNKK